MNLVQVKTKFFEEFGPFFKQIGFKTNKGDFSANNKDSGQIGSIYFLTYSGPYGPELEPKVCVKNNTIHKICEQNNVYLNYTAFIDLFTLYYIANGKKPNRYKSENRFVIESEEDILFFFKRYKKMLPYALDYIKKYSDIKEIDKLYNDDPFNEHNPNCSGRNTHYIIGLISSFLCNHNYEQIKGIYSELIKKTNEDAIADFQTIVDFLEKTKKELVLNTM